MIGSRVSSPPSPTTLDSIQALVESSLLQPIDGLAADEPRYRMLETIREFASERLEASGETPSVRTAHAAYVLEMVERVAVQTFASEFGQSLDHLRVEHDNVRAALDWMEASGADDDGLRLARAMSDFWMVRGHFREGRHWLEHFLDRAAPIPSVTRAGALTSIGWLTNLQGDLSAAESYLLNAVDAARAVEAGWLEAVALHGLGAIDLQRGELARAAERAETILDRWLKLEETAEASPQWTSLAFTHRGEVAIAQGDAVTARRALDEALTRQRALGFTWGMSSTFRILGDVARYQGAYDHALPYYREAVALGSIHGDLRVLTEALAGLASIAAHCGQADRAARLYGATSAHRVRLGAPVEGWDRRAYERGIEATRAVLSPDEFLTNWTAGEALSLSAFIDEALAVDASTVIPRPESTNPFGLTPREVDVVRLLAAGLSDRAIADALSISPRTVNGHVTNLLTKLGVDSRSAAAAFAVRHDLA